MITNLLPLQNLNTLYVTLIQSNLEYGLSLWRATHESHLTNNNKKAIRTITNSKYNKHTRPLFNELKLLKLNDLNKLNLGKFMHKIMHNISPIPLNKTYKLNTELHNYLTRNANNAQIRHRRT